MTETAAEKIGENGVSSYAPSNARVAVTPSLLARIKRGIGLEGLRLIQGKSPLEYLVFQPKHSKSLLGSYDQERHIELGEAYDLIYREELSNQRLDKAVESGDIHLYEFNGKKYLDKIDLGRVYHSPRNQREGLTISRRFTKDGEDPFSSVEWGTRKVTIKSERDNKSIFEMKAEFPKEYSDNSAAIVASKYFFKPEEEKFKAKLRDKIGRDHEFSLKQLATRIANYLADSGKEFGYFRTDEDKNAFADEMKNMIVSGKFAFNSPVEFNAGLDHEYGIAGNSAEKYWRNPLTGELEVQEREFTRPQCHACFIKGPRDDLESILQHVKDEGKVFSSGSGIGQDIGILRGEGEPLSGGGQASGAISFLKILDYNAGSIKSGGKSRRAARMTTMRSGHRDVMRLIRCKPAEDKKMKVLIENGYSGGMDGEAASTVALQNTNISIRLEEDFFDVLGRDGEVELKNVRDRKVVERVKAKRMLQEIAYGSWRIGDPAVQYDKHIQEMHVAKNSGRINSTNPCSEYVFLDDTSCNLASVNPLAFCDSRGNLDLEGLAHTFELVTVGLDIINDAAGYPIRSVAEQSPEFRTIGLGYLNLGALLMRRGVAYDSNEGRALIGALTAFMTGKAYETSTKMAEKIEPFVHYEFNKKPMMEVMKKHRGNLEDIAWDHVPKDLKEAAEKVWSNVLERGQLHGFRNAQTTVLAPTGTVYFLMNADTTGIEPVFSLITQKSLAGGGKIRMEIKEVPNALRNLGYSDEQIKDIALYITNKEMVIGAPHLNPDHYNVFATAKGKNGKGVIPLEGHVRMLGAAQPFISGAISKTCNLPNSSTVKEIYDSYLLGDKLKLKALAAFRDKSKPTSALGADELKFNTLKRGEKRELPSRRAGFTEEVKIGGVNFHIITGEYEDGTLGEVRIETLNPGSTMNGLVKGIGIDASTALKRGVPLEDLVEKSIGQSFEPNGFTNHPYIKGAASIRDFTFRLLAVEYLGRVDLATDPQLVKVEDTWGFKNGAQRAYAAKKIDDWDVDQVLASPELGGFVKRAESEKSPPPAKSNGNGHSNGNGTKSGVPCKKCGGLMEQIKANCYDCPTCGENSGGCSA